MGVRWLTFNVLTLDLEPGLKTGGTLTLNPSEHDIIL